MDDWLNNAPALVFIKDLSAWLIINHMWDPIMWIADQAELAWFFASIFDVKANETKKLRVVKKLPPEPVAQNPTDKPQQTKRPRLRVAVPMRRP
jgi:hypothetical protein